MHRLFGGWTGSVESLLGANEHRICQSGHSTTSSAANTELCRSYSLTKRIRESLELLNARRSGSTSTIDARP